MNAIDTLRQLVYDNCGPESPHETHEPCLKIRAALAKLETLLQAAERVVERDGTGRARLDALAAAVRDAKGATT